jgi:RNA polymerase sigma-70 factor (ECF subfamily)
MNQKTFLAMLEPLEPKLFGFAYRMLRDGHKVKDAMQEMYLRLWNKRKELKTNKNISAYCFKTMHNICIDELRTEARKGSSSRTKRSGDPGPPGNEQWFDKGTNVAPPSHDLERLELIQRIRTAVDQLPPMQKAIIELHDFQEMTYQEIAEILDMEINAIRVNLSRARARITAKFSKEEIYD